MNKFMKYGVATSVGLAALGMATMANAAILTFSVDPSTIGEANSPFSADEMTGGYFAEIDQTAGGSFVENGAFSIDAFRLGGNSVLGTGVNNDYQIYGMFTAAGSVASVDANSIQITFTSFLAEIWTSDIGAGLTTTWTNDAGNLGDQDGFAGQNGGSQFANSASAAFTYSNTADDTLVLQIGTGDLINGGASINQNGGGTEGNYQVLSYFNTDFFELNGLGADGTGDDFINFLQPILSIALQANGNTGNEIGLPIPPTAAEDVLFQNASLNITFSDVPEPATLGLLGIGLIGIGAMARRRKA